MDHFTRVGGPGRVAAMQGVLAGRYRLERQLGKGGMGSVWLAEHLALRSWVAVKLMDPAIAATPEGAERFRREAQAAASLRSAHVVQVLDYGVHEQTPYLVMELLQGESLAGCLEREQRLSPERTLAIITQVARALGRAHAAGIVHRDLKPDNVFLVKEDDQELVKILDFGIAKTPQAQFGGMETRTGVTMGTPYYMSPEQMEGKRALDFRTDLWAMAVITSECMSGVRPFDGSTFGELLLNVCARPIPTPSSQGLQLRGFDAWFAKATSRDPEQRFASAQELAATLKDVVTGAGSAGFTQLPGAGSQPALSSAGGHAPSVSSINTAQPLPVSRPSALPWILLGLLLLVGAVGTTVWLMRPKLDGSPASAASAASAASVVSASAAITASAASSELVTSPPPEVATTGGASAKPHPPAAPLKPAPLAPALTPTPTAAAAPATPTAAAAPATPTAAAAPATPTAAAAPPAAKTLRCFVDPFSGQIRPATNQPSAFACRQDPFTGKYRRL
jgi:serine/threonine protein kinase